MLSNVLKRARPVFKVTSVIVVDKFSSAVILLLFCQAPCWSAASLKRQSRVSFLCMTTENASVHEKRERAIF